MMNINDVFQRLYDDGISAVGVSNAGEYAKESLKQYRTAITMLYKLSDAVVDEITCEGPTYVYFQHYRAVNAFLDNRVVWLCEMIRRQGYKAFPIAASQSIGTDKFSGEFQHKTAAVEAGMGFIGKSALFISNEFGPRVRLATVLTDMPVEPTGKRIESKCGDCNICVSACPAQAIKGVNYDVSKSRSDIFDARACSEHMKKAYQNIGRGAVCGICMKVCPFGKGITVK